MIILSSEGLKINNETVGFTITQPSSPITKNQKTGDTLDLEKNPNAIIECELKNALIVTSTYACEFEYDGHQYNFNAKVTNQVYSAKDGYKVKLQIVGKVVVGGKSTAPTISYDNTTFTVSASGDGEVKMYVDGVETVSPHTFDAVGTYVVTATAEQDGKAISDTVTENITIAKTATPTISYDSTTFTVSASGNGTVTMYVDGVATVSPHTFTQGQSDVTYVVTATAQQDGKAISDTVTENCLVPATAVTHTLEFYNVDRHRPASSFSCQINDDGGSGSDSERFAVRYDGTAIDLEEAIFEGNDNCMIMYNPNEDTGICDSAQFRPNGDAGYGTFTNTVVVTYEGITATCTVNVKIPMPED